MPTFLGIFAERLRVARERADMSQNELALLIHVSNQTYKHYEKGLSEPRYILLVRIARELGVTTDFLLGLSD